MNTCTLVLGCLALVGLSSTAGAQGESVISIRAWVDGRSNLILDDNSAQWEHHTYAAPGRIGCELGEPIQPTYLEGFAWWPEWPDVPDCRNNNCHGCLSSVYTGLQSPLVNVAIVPELVILDARGPVTLIELPVAANDYRVVIEFDDHVPWGAYWYEVELVVPALPPCEVEAYCLSLPNSTGAAATIDLAGSLSIGAGDTRLLASGCPPGLVGTFIYGPDPVQMPFCNGYLCISPYGPGLTRVPGNVLVDNQGNVDLPLDFTSLPAYAAIDYGTSYYFQFWYRDGQAGGAGANLTNGVKATFCP